MLTLGEGEGIGDTDYTQSKNLLHYCYFYTEFLHVPILMDTNTKFFA